MARSESEQKDQIMRWRSSGLTAKEWSLENKIAYSTFFRWKRKWDANSKKCSTNETIWGEVEKPTTKQATNEAVTKKHIKEEKEESKAKIIYGRCEIEITEGYSEEGIIKILKAVEAVCC